jgi:hypothetical protein
MNSKKNLSEYSDEELLKTQKQTKTILLILGGFMTLAFIFSLYTAIKTKNYALLAISGGTFITILPLTTRLSMINKEIKSRKI